MNSLSFFVDFLFCFGIFSSDCFFVCFYFNFVGYFPRRESMSLGRERGRENLGVGRGKHIKL